MQHIAISLLKSIYHHAGGGGGKGNIPKQHRQLPLHTFHNAVYIIPRRASNLSRQFLFHAKSSALLAEEE